MRAYPSLLAVPADKKIDIVDVFRRPEHTLTIAREATAIGAKTIWLQLGIINDEAAATAKSAGINVIMDACIAVEHRRLLPATKQ